MLYPAYLTIRHIPRFPSSSHHAVLSYSTQRSPNSSPPSLPVTSIFLAPSLVFSLHGWFPDFFQMLLSYFVLHLSLLHDFHTVHSIGQVLLSVSTTLTSFAHSLFSCMHPAPSQRSLSILPILRRLSAVPDFICNSAHAFSTPYTSPHVLRSTVLSPPCSCTLCLTSHTSISTHHSLLAAFLICS